MSLLKLKRKQRYPHPKLPVMPGAEPYFYPGGKVGVLLVHGFSSTSYDTHPLGKYLAEKGYTVKGVLMEGHGTDPAHLAETKAEEWIGSVEDAYRELKGQTEEIFACGISLAGNILIHLAPSLELSGLVTMGTPVVFRKQKVFRVFWYMLRPFMKYYPKTDMYRHIDPEILERRINYDRIPMNAVKEIDHVVHLSKEAMPRVTCPVLVMQSKSDHTLDERTSNYLMTHLGSRQKELYWVRDGYHVFTLDEKAPKKVFPVIENFISRYKKNA